MEIPFMIQAIYIKCLGIMLTWRMNDLYYISYKIWEKKKCEQMGWYRRFLEKMPKCCNVVYSLINLKFLKNFSYNLIKNYFTHKK